MADVAREAQVGVSTVSYILRGVDSGWSISEKTKQRVREAAKQVDYRPNAAARALVTRRTMNIGFLLADSIGDGLSNPYFASQLVGVEQVSRQRGYGLRINRYTLAELDKLVLSSEMGHRAVDGMILTGFIASATAHRLTEFGLPCVSIGDTFETHNLMACVTHTFTQSLFETIQYLTKLGHQRIARYESAHNVGSEQTTRQLQQFINRDAKLNIHFGSIHSGSSDFAEGLQAFEAWYQQPCDQRPTALIMSEPMALAFLKALYSKNLTCPRDVSLVVSTESRMSEYAYPPLTAMNHHCEKLGQIAATLLLDHLTQNKKLTDSVSPVPTTLTVRESCGPPASDI